MSLAIAPALPSLRPFQEEGQQFLFRQKRAALCDEPGLGKTAQAIAAARGKTLVIAPAMVLDGGVWADELEKWTHLVAPGTDFTTISYHMVARREDEIRATKYETLICDESHYLKNRRAQMTQAVMALSSRIPRLYLMTGTPIPNWSHELWTTLRMLYPNDRRFSSYWRWVEGWFNVHEVEIRGRAHKEIGSLLETQTWERFREWNSFNDWLIRRLRVNHLQELPPLTEQVVKVPMTKTQKTFYDRLKADYVAWVAETGTEVSAWSTGGLHTKLAQVQTGVATVDAESENLPLPMILNGSGKLRVLQELLSERATPTVVFCFYRRTARLVMRLCAENGWKAALLIGDQAKTDRHEIVHEFQAGRTHILVGTIDTISEGLTLTAADTAIFVERTWRPYKNEQAMRRLHRFGQQHPVTVLYLITQGGVDARMTRVLEDKTEDQIAALTASDFIKLL